MSSNDQNASENSQQENEAATQTPLEQVKANQAAMQENREVAETHVDNSAEVPGQGPPSDKRHHPQRQMYGSGTGPSSDES